jgi:hypothetical protein
VRKAEGRGSPKTGSHPKVISWSRKFAFSCYNAALPLKALQSREYTFLKCRARHGNLALLRITASPTDVVGCATRAGICTLLARCTRCNGAYILISGTRHGTKGAYSKISSLLSRALSHSPVLLQNNHSQKRWPLTIFIAFIAIPYLKACN